MKQSSRFYSSLGWLILLNAIIKPIWIFGIDRQVQNQVGADTYGTYFSLMNLGIVFNFFLDWGLTTYYNRLLSFKGTGSRQEAGSLLFLKLLFVFLYSAIVLMVAFFSGVTEWKILFFIIGIQFLTSLFLFFRAMITAQQWFRTDAWMSVIDKLLMIIFCVGLLYLPRTFGQMTIERFLSFQTISTLLAVMVALTILVRRHFHPGIIFKLPGMETIRAALPFGLVVLLMSYHTRIDGFLLGRMNSAAEAGKYAAAYRLLDAANMVGYLFASFLLPFVARLSGEKKNFQEVALRVRHLLMLMVIIVVTTTLFLAPWIQQLLYHHNDPGGASVLQWCIPALIGYALVQVYGTVMTATGHIAAFCYIVLISSVLNTGLNLWLIPSMGAKGSCMAALASQITGGIATMIYCRQKLQLSFHIRSLLIYIFITGLLSGLFFISGDWQVSKWWIIVGAGILATGIAWLMHLVRPAGFLAETAEH